MSYSNYDPDDQQPAAPSTQPTARIAYVDVRPDSDPAPYISPAAYVQPETPPRTPAAAAYVQLPTVPHTPPAAHAQPPTPPYTAPPAAYPQPPTPPYNPSAHTPPHYPAPPAPRQPHRTSTATIVARFTAAMTSSVAFIFALHIFFSLTSANQSNGLVQFVYALAKVLVLGFGDVFTPNDAKIGLVLNYGFAALVYLVVGRLIARALRQ